MEWFVAALDDPGAQTDEREVTGEQDCGIAPMADDHGQQRGDHRDRRHRHGELSKTADELEGREDSATIAASR